MGYGWMAGKSGFNYRQEQNVFLFSTLCRPDLKST
jgi:hypothetical protein